MNRRSLLSLVAASTGLLCGARSAPQGPTLEVTGATWYRGPAFDDLYRPTGDTQVLATITVSTKGGMKLENGRMMESEWPDGPVARALLHNACVPPAPAGRKRGRVCIDVADSNVGMQVKFVYVSFLEVKISKWR